MAETLLSASNVLLFGRVVEDLQIVHTHNHNPFADSRKTANNLLGDQIEHDKTVAGTKARFARIYGFSFEGTYYDLPRPVLFLVHGPGVPAETAPGASRVSRAPDTPSRTGVAAPDFSFADDLMVWSYDKADYTIRMDVESGMFEQVLLEAFFDDGGTGWGRVSGAKVSGAKVSGAKVSGAKLAGAKLGGYRFRGDPTD
jgi:hypothetical protein